MISFDAGDTIEFGAGDTLEIEGTKYTFPVSGNFEIRGLVKKYNDTPLDIDWDIYQGDTALAIESAILDIRERILKTK